MRKGKIRKMGKCETMTDQTDQTNEKEKKWSDNFDNRCNEPSPEVLPEPPLEVPNGQQSARMLPPLELPNGQQLPRMFK